MPTTIDGDTRVSRKPVKKAIQLHLVDELGQIRSSNHPQIVELGEVSGWLSIDIVRNLVS
jgi:SAM-dependent MidA family methyltransferase